MPVKVFSRDADRQQQVSEPIANLSEVVEIVHYLRLLGHTEISVGTSGADALPYAQWKILAQGGPSIASTTGCYSRRAAILFTAADPAP